MSSPAFNTEESLLRSRRLGGASAPGVEDYVFDAWSPLAFKTALSGKTTMRGWQAPTWVDDHRRRLAAYKILAAYRENSARLFLQEPDVNKLAETREYGDGAAITNAVVGALLGDVQRIMTADADEVDADGKPTSAATRALKLQEWLDEWADKERLTRKVFETERDAVSLGDGVYSLGWNADKKRVRLRCWDPGFYFPVLNDNGDYAETVHMAWEETVGDKDYVRRITWRLVDCAPYSVPWRSESATKTVLMSDGRWLLNETTDTVDTLSPANAKWLTTNDASGNAIPFRDIDMRIDIIPVVHITNSVAEKEGYGKSTLIYIAQILDDLMLANTDLARSAATTGHAPVAVSGSSNSASTTVGYAPGTVWFLGEGGRMDVIDTSKSLDALLKYREALETLLTTNARVPDAVLGRVDASNVPSGLALALSFGPLEQMVKEMRLVREEKYPILFDIVMRLTAQNGGNVPDVWDLQSTYQFGSYLPSDQAGTVTMVTGLLNAGAISIQTAVQMLMNGGFPIDDAVKEVERIQHQDFDGAGKLLDATADAQAVFDYLGRKPSSQLKAQQQAEQQAIQDAAQQQQNGAIQLPDPTKPVTP